MSTIIPKADQYYDQGFNVLLSGMHGVGKTRSVLDLVREKGVVLKYYSCSTLDPYTDLVGVPVPRHFCKECRVHVGNAYMEDGVYHCPVCKSDNLVESLKMVRPHEIDEAELLFFDEFNRADPKVHNAIFEVIQFKSINGERLPHVKCVWAAMNPPGEDYQVEELDPALIDRFQIYLNIEPKPTVAFMTGEGLPKPISQALHTWWQAHNQGRRGMENFISPRKLVDIGKVYMATKDLKAAIPFWMKGVDRQKLADLLQRAEGELQGRTQAATGNKLGDGPDPAIKYNDVYLRDYCNTVAKLLAGKPDDLDTHQEVLKVLDSKQGKTWVRDYAEIMEAMKPSLREGYINNLNPGKYESLRDALLELKASNEGRYNSLPNFRKAVNL